MILYLEGDVSHLKAKATLKPLTLHDCQSLDSNKKNQSRIFIQFRPIYQTIPIKPNRPFLIRGQCKLARNSRLLVNISIVKIYI